MSADGTRDLELEIAHLLLIDIVGYSKLLMNEQIDMVDELNHVVRSAPCFRAAEQSDKLVRVPTGDGMALLFFRSPEEPVLCALEIAAALKEHPNIRVRMGIHSGPISHVTDVNDHVNVAGAGINVAQRVMDCGDADHILMTEHVASDLEGYRHWQPYLHNLGECEVKHGLRVKIVNVWRDGLGNTSTPEKLRPKHVWQHSTNGEVRSVSSARSAKPLLALAFISLTITLAITLVMAIRRSPAPDLPSAAPPATAGAVPNSIAVLPFENLSDDKQNAYFADGVHDEIVAELAKSPELKVISRTSVMHLHDDGQRNLRDIAKTLGATYILEGSVQRVAGRVRVTAQFIDARTDTHLWAERYERDVKDVFATETELAEKIVGQMKSKLAPAP